MAFYQSNRNPRLRTVGEDRVSSSPARILQEEPDFRKRLGKRWKLGIVMVARDCNLSTWETETKGSEFKASFDYNSKFQACLSYMRPYINKKR